MWQGLAEALQQHADGDAPLGLMLHHGPMTAADLDGLAGLLQALAGHGSVRWRAMRDIARQAVVAGVGSRVQEKSRTINLEQMGAGADLAPTAKS